MISRGQTWGVLIKSSALTGGIEDVWLRLIQGQWGPDVRVCEVKGCCCLGAEEQGLFFHLLD